VQATGVTLYTML